MVRQRENCGRAWQEEAVCYCAGQGFPRATGTPGGHRPLLPDTPHPTGHFSRTPPPHTPAASGTLSWGCSPLLGYLGWTPQGGVASTDQGSARDKTNWRVSGRSTGRRGPGLPRGSPLTTHRLQEADVLAERSDAAAEGEQEHEDAHHDQQDGRVHSQAGQRRLWGGVLSVWAGAHWAGCQEWGGVPPELSSSPGGGLSSVAR